MLGDFNAFTFDHLTTGSLYKGKGKGLDTCYSATDMSQTRDQQRFTISELRKWQLIAMSQWCRSALCGQLDPRCS